MKASELFDLPQSLGRFAAFFNPDAAPWEWVTAISAALASVEWAALEKRPDIPAGVVIKGDVYLHPTAKLPAFASIEGPTWIGEGTEIRPGAFIRGNVIVGADCVIGNSSEYKNCLLMDNVQTPHYNYVGDSVLGNKAHLGAGVICANLRLDQKEVPVQTPGGRAMTGLRKLGALMGEGAEAGCNAVLQPGSILGKRAVVMSTLAFSGYLEPEMMAYARTHVSHIRRMG